MEKQLVGESRVYPERWFRDLLGDAQVQVGNLFAGYHGEFDGGMGAVQISLKVGQLPFPNGASTSKFYLRTGAAGWGTARL